MKTQDPKKGLPEGKQKSGQMKKGCPERRTFFASEEMLYELGQG